MWKYKINILYILQKKIEQHKERLTALQNILLLKRYTHVQI